MHKAPALATPRWPTSPPLRPSAAAACCPPDTGPQRWPHFQKARMTVLLHLSDLHFGAHEPAVCSAVQRLAQRLGVAMVVVSGDLTQRATASQFGQAARFVKGLHARSTLVLAGNHDLPLVAWWLR